MEIRFTVRKWRNHCSLRTYSFQVSQNACGLSPDFWRNVVQTDESRVKIWGLCGCHCICRNQTLCSVISYQLLSIKVVVLCLGIFCCLRNRMIYHYRYKNKFILDFYRLIQFKWIQKRLIKNTYELKNTNSRSNFQYKFFDNMRLI